MNHGDDFGKDSKDELAKRIAYLINGYNLKNLTQVEHHELDDWVTASMRNQKLFEELTDPANLKKWMRVMENLDPETALKKIKSRIEFDPKPRSFYKTKSWFFWTAAAVLAGIIFLGAFWFEKRPFKRSVLIAGQHDLQPGGNHARLTLGDGTTILLDTVKKGSLPIGGDIQIFKDSSVLDYKIAGKEKSIGRQNILATPAGGEFQISLSDGTKVWLNASSSLKYPEQFSDSVRKVELTGEGYFEVSKDALHPFIVKIGQNQVRVLGTRFNVYAYADNDKTIVSLAEGIVKINGTTVLKSGEQGAIDPAGKVEISPADLEVALAWKEGQFIFKKTPLKEVMSQTAHWYNAKIVYQDNITEHFNAQIPRDVPVSQLLHLLEATGRVHFTIDDNTIRVMK